MEKVPALGREALHDVQGGLGHGVQACLGQAGRPPPAGGRIWWQVFRGEVPDLWRWKLTNYLSLAGLFVEGLGRGEIGAGPKGGHNAAGR